MMGLISMWEKLDGSAYKSYPMMCKSIPFLKHCVELLFTHKVHCLQ